MIGSSICVMTNNSFYVDNVFVSQLQVLISLDICENVLRLVSYIDLDHKHFLWRYLDVDLEFEISVVFDPRFFS